MSGSITGDVLRTLADLGGPLAGFGPRALAVLVVLAAGILATAVVRAGLPLLLRLARFDRLAERAGATEVLRRGGIRGAPSAVVGMVAAWLVLAAFVLVAVAVLDRQVAVDLLARALGYLPRVLVAAAVLGLGALFGAFLRRSVLIAAVNAGLPSARLLANGVQVGVIVLVAAIALEHLGVGRNVILISLVIVLGGVVLALALAFGLAGRHLARRLLERTFTRSDAEDEWDDPRRHV